MRQALDVIGAAQRIDDMRDAGLLGDDELVLRAMRAEAGVGKASASSNELVCSDCVPPSTAAIASIVVRMMLL